MIRSMTAYAGGERVTRWGTLGCELRSVNHRFLEVGVRLPEELRALEPQLREVLARAGNDLMARQRGGVVLQVWPGRYADLSSLMAREEMPDMLQSWSRQVAMLAAVAAGVHPDLVSASDRMVRIASTVDPDPELAARYGAAYPLFRDLGADLVPLWKHRARLIQARAA